MKCEKARALIAERFGQGFSPFLRLHLRGCPSCAAESGRVSAAVAELRSALPPAPDFSGLIMAAIRSSPLPEAAPVSFRSWLLAGAALLAAMGVSPLSASFGWAKSAFGTPFLIPLNLVLGLAVAAYCALFIGTHLREFSEKLKLKHD